jgi:hypothetical protein
MRAREFITELYFMGSPCTKDCSGHKAGYNWGKSHAGKEEFGPSPSFNKGTYLAKNYTPRAQGGGKVKGTLSQNPNAVAKRNRRAQPKPEPVAQPQPHPEIAQVDEATGDKSFDRMMGKLTDPNSLAAHARDERARTADHEFLQMGDYIWDHLEKLGKQIIKSPSRLAWYTNAIKIGDYAAISDWLTELLQITPESLEKLDELCYNWGRPLTEFVESVQEGTFNQDYVQHWKRYKAHAEGSN